MRQALLYRIAKLHIGLKRALLGDYYIRLGVQARYLYRSSQLFNDRWQQMGLDYAYQSFDDDLNGIGQYFFRKARHSPWPIKKRIVIDWFLGRPAQAYAISEDRIF